MSTNHANSTSEPGGPDEQQQSAEGQSTGQVFANAHLQINPDQPFREYTSPKQGTAPIPPLPPAYFAPGYYQAGQVGGAPGAPQPGGARSIAGIPGAPHAGAAPGVQPVPGLYPGYSSYGAYPGQGTGVPGQMPYYPGYPAYPQYAGYPGYSNYPGQPMYGYGWQVVPVRPKRDTYLLVVGIIAFSCSILVILGGLVSLLLVGLVDFAQALQGTLSDGTFFAGIILFLSFAFAGIVGGGFCLYHSIRSLFLRKASRAIWLPGFWVFLLCYLLTIGAGFWMHSLGLDAHPSTLTAVLIYLGGVFPALTIMALGVRRLSFPKANKEAGGERRWTLRRAGVRKLAQWPTSWRRWTLALVSGATLGIGLALILESLLEAILLTGSQSSAISRFATGSDSGSLPPSLYALVLIMFAVIAPLVEEMVKPLAVVVLIGRVRSKAEAFTLGLACGIGFNLIETTGYISSGYNDWLTVALVRSGAGLLHGFGAAMVALGWYYLTHKEEGRWPRRTLLALGCMGYAVFQHALWNGSVGLAFLPGPLGDFFQNWSWSLGPLVLTGIELVNIATIIAILIFFLFVSGRLRTRTLPQDNAFTLL